MIIAVVRIRILISTTVVPIRIIGTKGVRIASHDYKSSLGNRFHFCQALVWLIFIPESEKYLYSNSTPDLTNVKYFFEFNI